MPFNSRVERLAALNIGNGCHGSGQTDVLILKGMGKLVGDRQANQILREPFIGLTEFHQRRHIAGDQIQRVIFQPVLAQEHARQHVCLTRYRSINVACTGRGHEPLNLGMQISIQCINHLSTRRDLPRRRLLERATGRLLHEGDEFFDENPRFLLGIRRLPLLAEWVRVFISLEPPRDGVQPTAGFFAIEAGHALRQPVSHRRRPGRHAARARPSRSGI